MLLAGLATAMLAAGTVPVPAAAPCLVVVRGADFAGARLPVPVNALAYDAGQDVYYAVADGRNLVTITPDGRLTVLAPVPDGLKGAHVGTIAGGSWLLSNGGELVALDLATLSETRRVVLTDGPRIGDWDAWQEALFAVDTSGQGGPRLARIDPVSGRVTRSPRLAALPGDDSYGGVVIDSAGTLHALHNSSGRLVHIPLAAPESATWTEAGLTAESSDAAPCPRPPPEQPPLPKPVPRPAPEAEPDPEPEPDVSDSPIPTVVPSARHPARPKAHRVPDTTRLFFLGLIIPALVVAARAVARRR